MPTLPAGPAVCDMSRSLRLELVATPEVAAEIAPLLSRVIREARKDGLTLTEDAMDYLVGVLEARDVVRERLRAQPDAGQSELRGPTVESVNEITAAEYAKRHDVSTSAVTKRCRKGTLPGRRTPDGWLIAVTQEDA